MCLRGLLTLLYHASGPKSKRHPFGVSCFLFFSRGTESGIETEKYSVLMIKRIFLYERKEY